MINKQPYTKAKESWQRKLTTTLVAGVMVCLEFTAAKAVITNTVKATGISGGVQIQSSATTSVSVTPALPSLKLVKTGTLQDGGDGSADPGDTISYTFTITNTGNVTLQNVGINDPFAVLSGMPIPALAPGAIDSTTFTATHVLTNADVTAGLFSNIAIANGRAASGQNVSASAIEKTPLNLVSSMSLAKTGVLNLGANGRADAGDTITYSFVVTNTGPTPLHDVSVSDPLVNFASLAGQQRIIAMLNAAQQPTDPMTTAALHDAPVDAAALLQYYAKTAVPAQPFVSPNLNVERELVRMSGSGDTVEAGDKIGFVYRLYNTGDIPLTAISVGQPDAIAYGDSLDILAPNAQDTATIIYTREVTDDEIISGEIVAPATVSSNVRGTRISQSLKGTLPLSGIKAYDSFASASIAPTTVLNLAAGQSTTFTATYTLTQANIDAGVVNNTATASAKNLVDQTLTSVKSYSQPIAPAPAIALIKSGNADLGADNVASLGDIVTYSFDIINTGNVTLYNIDVTDPNATVVGAPIVSLAPGITKTAFTATHVLVQADLDAGKVLNQATVSSLSPTLVPTTDLSDPNSLTSDTPTTVSLAPNAAIALLKTFNAVTDVNGNGRNDVGDTITYNFSVKNVGNQTLTNVIVTDPKITVLGAALPSLAPNIVDATHFTGVYTITQADMDKGEVVNTATADGTAPDGTHVIDLSDPGVLTADAPTITPLVQQPKISLVKTQDTVITDTNNNSLTDAGDVIHYTFTVSNSGNVTLSNVNIVDNLVGATVQGTPLLTLAPNAVDGTTFKATYTITAADMIAGRVSNQATANGTSPITTANPSGTAVSDLSDNLDPTKNNPTVTPLTVQPALAVVKSFVGITDRSNGGLSATPDGTTNAGDIITYTFKVKNTGNVTLTNVYINDANAVMAGAHIASLPAGNEDDTTFTATHVITPTDVIDGQVSNQAQGFGTAPDGSIKSDLSDHLSFTENDPTITKFNNAPSIGLVKTTTSITDTNNNGINDAGDIIHYALVVTNTGNLALINITVTDDNGVVTVNGGPLANLAIGATDGSTFTATHTLTKADVAAGFVRNQAKAHAFTTQTSGEITDLSDSASNTGSSPTITPLLQVPAIALVKTVSKIEDTNGNGLNDVGDVIVYNFAITNTGNVDINDLVLTDANATLLPNPATLPTLAPGVVDTKTFTARHLITIADAQAGFVSNTALISGKSSSGKAVADTSDKSSVNGNAPTITLVVATVPVLTKTASKSELKRGETVVYTITASNLVGGPFQITDIMPPGFGFVAGTATVNGAAATPVVNERNVAFTGLMPASGKITLKLKLMASTTLGGGKFVNNAHLIDPASGKVIATAQATVTITDEPVFDCSDIIGHVFDDKNHNGYMDAGELGLPGVRVVTLDGTLITTDSKGRFHVPCAAIPNASIGSNFLMKLDVRTLPTGYKMTTENPRDVRVTRGKVTELNFGAALDHEVRVDVTGKAFDPDSTELTAKWATGIDKLVGLLCKQHGTLLFVYHRGGEPEDLAQNRLAAFEDDTRAAWAAGQCNYKLKISSRVEDGK